MRFLDIAPLTPEEIFWINFEQYLPLIGIGVLAVAAVAAVLIVFVLRKKK